MTSPAIMGNDLSGIIANNSKNISKKNEIANSKKEAFSKVLEKNSSNNSNRYDTKVDSKYNRYENNSKKTNFHKDKSEIMDNSYRQRIKEKQSMMKKDKSFVKEDFAEDITDAINDIADAYKENLDITDEELMSIMESLSINLFQLPIRELAKDIVIAVNGENDITGLLVNENALSDLQSMNQFFDQYNPEDKLNMPVEELEGLIEEAVQNLTSVNEEIIDGVASDSEIMDNMANQVTNSTDILSENVDNISTNGVTMVDSIDVGDGNSIDIEIVDMRNNMTIENTVTTDTQLDSPLDNLVNNNLSDSTTENVNISNANGQEITLDNVLDNTFVGNTASEDVIDNDIKNNLNIIENSINNKADSSSNVVENQNAEDITLNTTINNQIDLEDATTSGVMNELQNDLISDNVNDKNINLSDIKDADMTDNVDSNKSTITNISTDDNVSLKENNFSQESFTGQDKKQSSDKTAVETFYDKFITNLEKSFSIEEGGLLKEVSNIKEMREIVNQIVDKIKININKDSTTMKLNLNPEHLGKVELAVTSKAGVMTAEFVVENKTAKEAIEKGLPALIEKFEEQGLKVEAVEVSISDYDFTKQDGERRQANDYSHSDKKKKRGGKINMDDMSVDNEPPITRTRERKIMSSTGIDYTV